MRIDGILKSWNDERGFGFIEPFNGGQEIFVHIKAIEGRSGRPQAGQRLSFEVEIGPDGKKRAKSVQVVRVAPVPSRRYRDSPAPWGTVSYLSIPAFLVVYAIVAVLWNVPHWVGGLYVAASAGCFAVYFIDKSAAVAGRWRVSEATLVFVGLAGGWPGAIVAQQILRHKSTKRSFRSAFWGSVVLNVTGFVALSSPLSSLLLA